MKDYIVIFQQILCGSHTNFEIQTSYSWDGQKFETREAAIRHGMRTRSSDDFNIGVVDGKTLIAFDWMAEPVDGHIEEAAKQLGFAVLDPPGTVGA